MTAKRWPGGALILSWGPYGGFYVDADYGFRLCLGWLAFTYLPCDPDDILSEGLKAIEAADIGNTTEAR